MEYDDHRDPCGDSRVGDVEYRSKEKEFLSTPERKPIGEGTIDEREVQHVNHTTEKERGVAALLRHECGDLVIAVVEEDSVEHRV